MKLFTYFFLAMVVMAGCGKSNMGPSGETGSGSGTTTPVKDSLTYLALGDSYTVGTGITADQSFPVQLANALNQTQYKTKAPKIVAQNGLTTGDLLTLIPNSNIRAPYSL
ncbi:MAG: hypothetical protein INR69_19490, partial [Mucilaginibacter polytrichastri]|nr:hypothetical protein [Mucilaginibacter polytrichastri]